MAANHTFCEGKIVRSAPCSAASAAGSVHSLVEKGQTLNADIVVNLKNVLGVLQIMASAEKTQEGTSADSSKRKRKDNLETKTSAYASGEEGEKGKKKQKQKASKDEPKKDKSKKKNEKKKNK